MTVRTAWLGLGGDSHWATRAEPEIKDGESEESAYGIEQGIVRGSLAAGDEGLVDFVQCGIAESDEERGQSPGPAPAGARPANAAVKEHAEDKIFGEVGGFTDVVVNDLELMRGNVRFEPADDGPEKGGSVLGGKSICRHGEDERGPQESRPPGAQPCGNQELGEARLHLGQMRGGARVAPGLIRQVG